MDYMQVNHKRRLIVFVPQSLAGNQELARKIYQMASQSDADILFLALIDDYNDMLAASRCMITMKAAVTSPQIMVEWKIVETNRWQQALRSIYRSGDRIVCHAEQSVRNGFMQTIPLSAFLASTWQLPVTTISGFFHPPKEWMGKWLRILGSWAGFAVILLVFTLLEIQINRGIHNAWGTILLAGFVLVEMGAFYIWNEFTSWR
ncbi:MAG TPA: hypothetical protein VIO61_06825 [Anaerolineaceae bacterium]